MRWQQTGSRLNFVIACVSRAVLSYAFVLVACATPSRDSSPVQTDSLVYHLRRSPTEPGALAYVTAVYRNVGAGPVYFPRCTRNFAYPMYKLRRTGADSTRRLFTDWAFACVGGVPTGTIPPGDSVVIRVRVGSIDQPTMYPPLRPGDLIGDLRVELELCDHPSSDSDSCELAPQAKRSSNAFNVRY